MNIYSIQALFIGQNMYTTIQTLGVSFLILKKMNTFIQQGCIKPTKSDS